MGIITKFTIATDQGLDALLMLTTALATEKFGSLVEQTILDQYLAENFNAQALIDELNNRSNQWLVVYVNDQPAGYALITTKGMKPPTLDQKRAIRIADFGVLSQYADPAVKGSLLGKCLTICRSYPDMAIWINEYVENPLIEFFESHGFIRQPGIYRLDELPLASAYLIA